MISRLTGLEVCVALRDDTQLARVPIILLTAQDQEADVQRAESIAISLLPKLCGADRDALTHMLEANGVIDHAVRGLGSRSAARRQRLAELLVSAGVGAPER